jgi:hypothetical protein
MSLAMEIFPRATLDTPAIRSTLLALRLWPTAHSRDRGNEKGYVNSASRYGRLIT